MRKLVVVGSMIAAGAALARFGWIRDLVFLKLSGTVVRDQRAWVSADVSQPAAK